MKRLANLHSCILGAWCAAWLLLSHSPSFGQEVEWRTDYAAARREALEKNRPLVIDVGTESCFYCKKLDQTTFRDPTVISLMNDRYVPLKYDAQRDVNGIASSLGIQSYPTVVLASPDGTVLKMLQGYQDAAPFQQWLQHILDFVAAEDSVARDSQAANKALEAGDYATAISLLRKVIEDNRDRPVQLKAREALQQLEQQAAARLARARQLADKGQNAEALEAVNEVVRVYAGSQAALEANRLAALLGTPAEPTPQQRQRRAQDYLNQARDDFRTQQYVCCLSRCETLLTQFADLPESAEAARLAADIKSNPDLLRQTCDSMTDQLGSMYLALAETLLQKGQPQQAMLCLERVVQAFPGTRQAEAAQLRLSQIQSPPTQPVDYKKP